MSSWVHEFMSCDQTNKQTKIGQTYRDCYNFACKQSFLYKCQPTMLNQTKNITVNLPSSKFEANRQKGSWAVIRPTNKQTLNVYLLGNPAFSGVFPKKSNHSNLKPSTLKKYLKQNLRQIGPGFMSHNWTYLNFYEHSL